MKKDKKQVTIIKLLINLFQHIERRRRFQFFLLIGLTLIASVAEVISLGSIIPFLGVLTQPEKVFNYSALSGVINVLGITSAEELVLPLTVAFAIAALVAAGLRLLLLWVSIQLANATGADLSIEVYRRTLYQPYSVHVARSSSEIISGITQKVSTATSILISFITVVTSIALFLAILGTLLVIDPKVAVVAMMGFGSVYVVISIKTRYRLKQNSHSIAREQTQLIKALQEGLGAIRDVLLDGSQAIYCDVYQKSVYKLRKANSENTYINQAPRYVMEALGMVLISVLAYVLSFQDGGIAAALPILAALALGAQRLLPILQQLYGNWSVITGSQAALIDVLTLLQQPLPKYTLLESDEQFEFNNEIKFEDVRFRFGENNAWVLDNVSFSIPKGSRVGFIGSTGSGKSTTLDLLMGLLKPTHGRILVDGLLINDKRCAAWQNMIAHVPQNIFLADASIAENIAFGIPLEDIDYERVIKAAEQAQISDFIDSLPERYQSFVGERGVRISGGQRQRIGIARALYKQAKVLVFDEATSALDSKTEKDVMNAVECLSKDITILLIAHRISSLKYCNKILKMEKGKVNFEGPYEKLIEDNQIVEQ